MVAGRLLTEMILPVSQFFAYLEVGETGGSTFDMPDSSLWTLYQRLRADGAPLSIASYALVAGAPHRGQRK